MKKIFSVIVLLVGLSTIVLSQEYSRVRFANFKYPLSIDVPKGTKMESFYAGRNDKKNTSDQIMEIYLFGGLEMGDLYFKSYDGSMNDIRNKIKSDYLWVYFSKYIKDSNEEIILEYKDGDRVFYQLYGVITIDSVQFEYSSNRANEEYSLEKIKKVSVIARSVKK